MKLVKFSIHIIIIVFLTFLTQVGGIVYAISFFIISKRKLTYRLAFFTILYLLTTFVIVPNIAPYFGREKVIENKYIQANTFFTKLSNRNYVKPELNTILQNTAIRLDKQYKGIQVVYLDANFPFIDNFPLLPHLSHNDGKKIDLSLIYNDVNGKITNKKPSISGYGIFVKPIKNEYNQTKVCKNKGYWQYDYSKYATFGSVNKSIYFSEKATKTLINEILENNNIGKIFIEPHLKNRMNLTHQKIRFHGCKAVRHDDHIHIQLK